MMLFAGNGGANRECLSNCSEFKVLRNYYN